MRQCLPLTGYIRSYTILVGRYTIIVRSGVGQRHGVLAVSSPAESLAEIIHIHLLYIYVYIYIKRITAKITRLPRHPKYLSYIVWRSD